MAIISYADAYKKHLEEQKNADKKDIGLTRKYSLESGSDPGADIVLGTLFMNPAKIARGVASATGKETSEGAKKALGWASMPGAKIEQGFFGAAEGITDFLAGGAAQIAGQKDAAKWIYNHSWSRDAVGADVTDEYIGDAAESKGYQLASDLISGVGNVGFQVAVGYLIGGALAAPVANGAISQAGARAISFAPLFASASGAGTAENIAKTGELGWRENVGGLLKGGVEVLTEIASPTGRIANAALFGKSAKGMSRYLVKHAIAKNIIVNFAEEAGEEAASYVGDYYIEKWLKISDDKFSWGDLGYQAVLGGITGALFSSPSDISFVRQARSAGAKVYAQGDAAVKNKINEGLIEVKLLKERGLNNDNVILAEAALAKLTTDENLSQTTKEYYLGLAEQMVLKQNLSDQYTALAKELVEKAKADPATAQSMADAFNALVNEAGGEGKYTAADFTNENSEAARIYVVAQMANDWLSRSDAEIATDEIMRRKAALYQGTAEQKNAIRSMEDGSTVAFRVGANAYAVVTKRAGTDTYSVGFTTPGQVERDGAVYATHKLSADKVEELLAKPMTEQQIDAGIVENLAKKAQAEVAKEQKAEKKQAKAETKKKPAAKTEAKTEEATKKKAETESKGKKKTPVQAKKAGEEASLSPAIAETEQTAKTEAKEKVAPEDLSTVEKRLTSAFGIDGSEFTKEEWTKARECVPNIDGLTRREQARVLTLVRTAQANGINEDYMKGLARLSSVYGFGVVFEDIDVAGFYSRKNGMVVINPNNLDETYGHEIEHSFDQIVKEGKAEFRTDLSEKVKRIVGASVFDRAKAQYKADYEKLRARDGSVAELSDAELEAEAAANVVGKYLSNMTLLKKIAATDYSLGRGLLAAIRRMKDKWTSAKAFAKENDSTAFVEYRKMTRIENLLMKELGNKEKVINNSEISYSVSAVKTKSGDLVALHNLSEDRLKKAIELGGFPMPSIAVTKTSLPHTGYGDITVVFGESTIDPEMDVRNYVYDRDGWTPTAPKVDVKLAEDKVDNLVSELKKSAGDKYYADRVFNLFDGRFRDNSGEYIVPDYEYNKEKIGQYAYENAGVLAAYLNENGIDTSPVYSERTVNLRYTYMPVSEARRLLARVGITQDMDARTTSDEKRAEIRKKFYEYQDETMLEKLNGKESTDKLFTLDEVKRLNDKNRDGSIDTALFWLADDTFSGNEQKVVDNYATLEMLQNKVESKEAFYNWIWEKFSKTFEKRGIDNDSDIFDRRGNRRSFEQRHYDYTIENVIRAMKKGEQTGTGVLFGGVSAGSLAAKLSRQFDSISSIREAQDYLARVSEEDMKAFEDKTYELFDEVVSEIAGKSGDLMNDMTRRDDVGQILAKCAESSPLTVANIKRVFERETQGYNLNYKFDGEIARKVLSLFQTLENVPTMYFEAKPRRAVGLSEIKMVEIPNTASKELRTLLANNDIPFEVYGETDEQRTRAISNLSDVSFSPAPVSSATDSRYLFLARDPQKNESELRRLVKQAAEKAGFNSPLLYHGTHAFGFTEFDLTKGDHFIFATTNKDVAKTYVGETDRTKIAERTLESVDNLTGEDLLKRAKQMSPEKYGSYYLVTERERADDLRDARRQINELSEKVKEFKEEWYGAFDGKKEKIVNSIIESINNMANAVNDDFLLKAKEQYQNAMWDFKWEDETLQRELTELIDKRLYEASRYLDMALYNGDLFRRGANYQVMQSTFENTIYDNQLSLELEADIHKGVYELYGRMNDPLDFDAKGANWNSIDASDIISKLRKPDKNGKQMEIYWHFDSSRAKTRDIAYAAQFLGYDGVIIRNLRDVAGETDYKGTGDIFIFDAKNKVKSADPVTYDDSGNIIPLSERFNPQNDDIRYSPASSGSGRIVIQASQSRPNIQERITNAKGELTRENFRKAVESLKVIGVNAQQGVENQLVRAGMTKREAAAFSQLARSGRSHAINAICYKLADMTGAIRSEGLIPILEPFLATKGEVYPAVDKDGNTVQSTAKGGELAGKRYSEFSDYYAMLHAIDRAAVGKNPYSSMTVAQMKQIVAEYEQKNPDFKAAAEKLSAFNSAMLDIEVQAGIIPQETADLWRKQYPHYVPMYTQDSNAVGGKPVRGSRNMEVRRDNAAATESDHRVSDPLRNYIDQVQRRIRAAKLNILLNEVYNSADGVNVVTAEADRAEAKDLREREQAYLENPESENDPAEMFRKFKRGKNTVNEVSFYKDGKRVTMAVTDRIYTGLSDLGGIHSSILDSWTVKAVKKVNDTFKKLVTNWNPFFAVKNIARDLQDGTLQSRFGMGEFLNMYRKNAEMMATGKYNDMWEEFLANGGLESSLYSDEFGTFTKGGKSGLEQATGIVGQFQHIKNFNTLTEALPRFTEYCLTRKHGGSVQTALLNAADVTVNFGRSGTLIRILNSTVSPFLNPAVQGLDRLIRLFTEEGIKNNKALASLLLKAVLLAIIPMALGNAMYGDDDEYKDMKDSVKENNYLFKIGDTWLKLPRGRVVSTISGLFNRSYKQLTGQETDWGDYGKNVLDQITPAQNVARHIGSPFYDVANNRTWYGTKIESDALQNYAVNQRYDENTSRISVWIGQLTSHFGLSPKEVNYLIDQYTGVVGDILLPTTTPAGTKGVVSYNFTVDPNTSSNLSNRFYDLYNKTMYKSNDGDVEAYYLKKRLDETKSAVSELFKQIKTINASSELSNKEKVKQASAIRASINQLYKTALDDRRLYEQNIKDALAIENSYAVEKITAQSAKRYGLDKDSVGKYALTFGGDFVKQYDTEAQANDYKADASKKTVYAEANRLTYGAEYALREYNVNVYDKAKTLNELGISYDEYYNFYMTARYYSGKTKKDKILAYLNGSGLSKSQIALMMYYSGYTAYADEAKKAIKSSSLSAERKKELLAGLTN